MDIIKKAAKTYGFLWTRNKNIFPIDKWHFNIMQKAIDEPIVRGQCGIDIGSGCGYDTYIMAKSNSLTKIISVDISDGIYRTQCLVSGFKNVRLVKCSILDIPIKDDVFDFAYSFGVLHHTTDPERCLLEAMRTLKKDAPIFLYLYEDHSQNPVKYIAIKIITELRKITTKMPPKILYLLSYLFSPFVVMLFSIPSKILIRFTLTQDFANNMPFNFGTNLFSLAGDIYDRFSAPIEHRFFRHHVNDMLRNCGFYNIKIIRLKDRAGWITWGYKV